MRKITRPICPNPSALSGNYKHPDNKKALASASNEKCIYCESKISHVYHGDIEHIKPKSIYANLEFAWENLGFVCAKCNGIKSNKYDKQTPFIDPYIDEPSDHIIAFGAFLSHKQGSERGQITIDEKLGIGLNRKELIEKRQERIEEVTKAIDACFKTSNPDIKKVLFESLKDEAKSNSEYSLCIEALLKAHQIIS